MTVPLDCLKSPPPGYAVRGVDDKHFREMEKEIIEKPHLNFTMCVGFTCNVNATIKQIENGEHDVYILGGNHSILARQSIMNSHLYSLDPKYAHLDKVKVRVYGDLTPEEALHVGTEHNKIHNVVKVPTFEDNIKLFRRVVFKAGGMAASDQGEPPEGAETDDKWRDSIKNILGLNSVRL